MHLHKLKWKLGVALVGGLMACTASAQTLTKIRFTLDWKLQGIHAPFYLAQDKGYFKNEGLEVVIDQGVGSGATVGRIMSGAYDAGFGDINPIIEQAALRPGQAPVMVYQVYSKSPFVAIVKADGPIKKLADIQGRTMGGPAGSATIKLLPGLIKRNKLDKNAVSIMNVQASLGEQMLNNGQIDAFLTYNTNGYFNLLQQGKDPDKDYRFINFADYGFDLYSNGVMVSQNLLKSQPAAVAGLVRALNKAYVETAANQKAAIAGMKKIEPTFDVALEERRSDWSFRNAFLSDESRRQGFGDVDPQRLKSNIDIVVEYYGLPRTPAASEVFNSAFLPTKSERIVELR